MVTGEQKHSVVQLKFLVPPISWCFFTRIYNFCCHQTTDDSETARAKAWVRFESNWIVGLVLESLVTKEPLGVIQIYYSLCFHRFQVAAASIALLQKLFNMQIALKFLAAADMQVGLFNGRHKTSCSRRITIVCIIDYRSETWAEALMSRVGNFATISLHDHF